MLLDGGSGNDVINATAKAGNIAFDVNLNTNVVGGSGNYTIDATADGRSAGPYFGFSRLANTVDGGSGNDHITAYAESEFQGYHSYIANQLFGGSGDDVLDATARGRSNLTRDTINELHGGPGDDLLHAFNLTDSNRSSPTGITSCGAMKATTRSKRFIPQMGRTHYGCHQLLGRRKW